MGRQDHATRELNPIVWIKERYHGAEPLQEDEVFVRLVRGAIQARRPSFRRMFFV